MSNFYYQPPNKDDYKGSFAGIQYKWDIDRYNRQIEDAAKQYRTTLGGISDNYQKAYDSAKETNEGRYQEALAGYSNLLDRGMQDISRYGYAAANNIKNAYRKSDAATVGGLARSGMLNSTLAGTARKSSASAQGRDLATVKEDQLVKGLNYRNAVEGQRLGIIERRQDEYPDAGLYNQQISSITQAAAAQGIPMQYILDAVRRSS
jgi:hypothetical protein